MRMGSAVWLQAVVLVELVLVVELVLAVPLQEMPAFGF
jgi:hypothetical protein